MTYIDLCTQNYCSVFHQTESVFIRSKFCNECQNVIHIQVNTGILQIFTLIPDTQSFLLSGLFYYFEKMIMTLRHNYRQFSDFWTIIWAHNIKVKLNSDVTIMIVYPISLQFAEVSSQTADCCNYTLFLVCYSNEGACSLMLIDAISLHLNKKSY